MPQTEFETIKKSLEEANANTDTEAAHRSADSDLIDIALSNDLTYPERITLVKLYKRIKKWYA